MKIILFIIVILISSSCCVKRGEEHIFLPIVKFENVKINNFWQYYNRQKLCKRIEIFDSLLTPIINYQNYKIENKGYVGFSLTEEEVNSFHPDLIKKGGNYSSDCNHGFNSFYIELIDRKINYKKIDDVFHWIFVDIMSSLNLKYWFYLQFPYPEYSSGYPRNVIYIFLESEYVDSYNYESFKKKIKKHSKCK